MLTARQPSITESRDIENVHLLFCTVLIYEYTHILYVELRLSSLPHGTWTLQY